MKLLLVLTTDKGDFITKVAVETPEGDLNLLPVEFSFRNCVMNKALETLLAQANMELAMKRSRVFVQPGNNLVN